MFRYDFGQVGPGSHLTLNIDLEDWFSGGVDAYVVEQANIESFLTGVDTWNRNATFFDISYNNWYFEPIISPAGLFLLRTDHVVNRIKWQRLRC